MAPGVCPENVRQVERETDVFFFNKTARLRFLHSSAADLHFQQFKPPATSRAIFFPIAFGVDICFS